MLVRSKIGTFFGFPGEKYCRGRVARPGGTMWDVCIIFGESVAGRFRDGKPVPYMDAPHDQRKMSSGESQILSLEMTTKT